MKKNRLKVFTAGIMAAAFILAGCGKSDTSMAVAEDYYYNGDAAAETAMPAAGISDYRGVQSMKNSVNAKSYEAGDYYEEAEMDEAMADGSAGSTNVTEGAKATGRKLIRTVGLDVETKEFDALRSGIEKKVTELGGYVERSNIYNGYMYDNRGRELRNASMTLRIPASRLDEFISAVSASSNVVNQNENVRDITLEYVDTDSRKQALKTEEKRLLEMLASAETVEDMIYIEDRLSDIRYELQSTESQLRTYDNQVDYSTVNLSISEVKELTEIDPEPLEEPTTWERITKGFKDSASDVLDGLKEFGIGFIVAIPYLLVWAVVIFIIVLIIKGIIKACKKSAAKNAAKRAERKAAMAAGMPGQMSAHMPGNMPVQPPVQNPAQPPVPANVNEISKVQEAGKKD